MSLNVAATQSGFVKYPVNPFASVRGVSVIMPTLNEAGNIETLIRATVQNLTAVGIAPIEIIVVDDDSADHTWEIAQAVKCPEAYIHVIRRTSDHGLTASLRCGIDLAQHEVVVWLDCDFSHPPEKIPQMIYMITQGYDIAVNSRYTIGGGEDRAGKGGLLQVLLSSTLNWGVRFLLGPSFSDYTSGFVAARREVLRELPLRGDYGEYFIDFIYRALRKRVAICELPYMAPPRKSGESKTGDSLSDYAARGRKYLTTVARLSAETILGKM